jgi:hypothetical protein
MPICTGKDEKGAYTTWSHKTGKLYYHADEGGPEGALDKAIQQAKAAHAAGYESDRTRCMRKGEKVAKREHVERPPSRSLREDHPTPLCPNIGVQRGSAPSPVRVGGPVAEPPSFGHTAPPRAVPGLSRSEDQLLRAFLGR